MMLGRRSFPFGARPIFRENIPRNASRGWWIWTTQEGWKFRSFKILPKNFRVQNQGTNNCQWHVTTFFFCKKKHDCVKFVTSFNDTNLERNPPLNGACLNPAMKIEQIWGIQICATCAMCWSEAKVGESRGEVWLGASIVGIRWWGNVSSNFLGLMLSLFVSNFCDHTLMSSWPASKKTRVFF